MSTNLATPNSNPTPVFATPAEIVERAVWELPAIEGVFLFDPDGALLATAGTEAANDAAVLALVNGLVQLADRASADLGRGAVRHVAVQGQAGHIVASVLDSGHSLVVLGRDEARLGLLLHDLEWLGGHLATMLV